MIRSNVFESSLNVPDGPECTIWFVNTTRIYNTNETVPGMPETKETFDWMAPIRLRRATRILPQRVVRPGISQADCCCTTYYNGLGIIVITIRAACTWRCALGLGLGLGLGLEMSEIGR